MLARVWKEDWNPYFFWLFVTHDNRANETIPNQGRAQFQFQIPTKTIANVKKTQVNKLTITNWQPGWICVGFSQEIWPQPNIELPKLITKMGYRKVLELPQSPDAIAMSLGVFIYQVVQGAGLTKGPNWATRTAQNKGNKGKHKPTCANIHRNHACEWLKWICCTGLENTWSWPAENGKNHEFQCPCLPELFFLFSIHEFVYVKKRSNVLQHKWICEKSNPIAGGVFVLFFVKKRHAGLLFESNIFFPILLYRA